MKIKHILAISLLLCALSGNSQNDVANIEQVIYDIFDGMREGDSARVANNFFRDASMNSISFDKDGNSVMHNGSLQPWLNAVGTPREEILDERIWDLEVRVDNNLATVWTWYALYVGEKYSHCGVDSFQMFYDGEKWKVFSIADTRRKECDIPLEVQNGKNK